MTFVQAKNLLLDQASELLLPEAWPRHPELQQRLATYRRCLVACNRIAFQLAPKFDPNRTEGSSDRAEFQEELGLHFYELVQVWFEGSLTDFRFNIEGVGVMVMRHGEVYNFTSKSSN